MSAYDELMQKQAAFMQTPGYMEKQAFGILGRLGRKAVNAIDNKLLGAFAARPKTTATLAAAGGVGLPASLYANLGQYIENAQQAKQIEDLSAKADTLSKIMDVLKTQQAVQEASK